MRKQLLTDPPDYESLLLKTKADTSDDVIDIFQGMGINDEKEDIFPCSECDDIYKKPWTLKTHLRKKHNISKDALEFKCDICEEVFPDQNNLSKHKKIYQTIFACQECKEVFFSKKDLTNHKKSHLVCRICTRVCDTKFLLNRHIANHKL